LIFNKHSNLVEVLEPGVSLDNSSGLGLIGNSTLAAGNSIGIGLEGKGDILSPQTILGGTGSQEAGISEGLQAASGLSEEEETLCNFLPTYREVLTLTQIPIFVGGVLLDNQKTGKVEGSRGQGDGGCGCRNALIKGAVLGGLETYFSPIKTRSARKLGKEKELSVIPLHEIVTGPRALRAQKALARVKI
jgi:hypothetical protein